MPIQDDPLTRLIIGCSFMSAACSANLSHSRGNSGNFNDKHDSHKSPSGPREYPPATRLTTAPHLSQCEGSKDGGFSSFTKLYSLVPW